MTIIDLHPTYRNSRFTLRGIFRSREDALDRGERLSEEMVVWGYTEESPEGNELFFLCAQHDVSRSSRTGIPHQHSVDWDAVRMAVEAFRGIERKARSKGVKVRWYKELDVEALRRCILAYDWDGARLDVAANILSDTILTHPFPNANHRTSSALMRMYLHSEAVDWPGYELRGRGRMDRYHQDLGAFTLDSKVLLQHLRRPDMLRIAFEEGYQEMRLGPGEVAQIREADLERSADELREHHHGRSKRFIEELSDTEGEATLHKENHKTLRDWVQWYRSRRSR